MASHRAKVTSKGQVTVPVAIRRELGLQTGSALVFDSDGKGLVTVAVEESPLEVLRRYYGTMPLPPGMTGTDLAAMGNEIGTAEAIKHDRRSIGR